jgi:predicted RNase H-related nuclease YkuK (DUF458 family)
MLMNWRSQWLSPSDKKIRKLSEVISFIKDNIDYSIYIGCDSHSAKNDDNKYIFAIAICLISDTLHNKYFYSRGIHSKSFISLQARLTEEVAFSAETALMLIKFFPSREITIHADSSQDIKNKSAKFTDMFKSWATGIGCSFASKPNAWASSSVADKHSK